MLKALPTLFISSWRSQNAFSVSAFAYFSWLTNSFSRSLDFLSSDTVTYKLSSKAFSLFSRSADYSEVVAPDMTPPVGS